MIAEKIDSMLVASMKSGDQKKVDILRMLKNALKNEVINSQKELDESREIAVLKKEVKQRKDAVEQYEKVNRQDLADKEQKEIEIIESFLPVSIPVEEISAVIDQVITSTGASNMSDMGRVIGQVMGQVGDRADGKTVSDIVKSKLSA